MDDVKTTIDLQKQQLLWFRAIGFSTGENHIWLLTKDRNSDLIELTWKVLDERGGHHISTIEPTGIAKKKTEPEICDGLKCFADEMEAEFIRQGSIVVHDEEHEITPLIDVHDYLKDLGLLRLIQPSIPYSTSTMGKLSRTKGHSYERELAIEFQELGWKDARRQLEYNEKDANGIDLQGTKPFLVQSKRCKGYVPVNTINEIDPDKKSSGIPLLITKADHQPAMAVLPWEDLKGLLRIVKRVS